MALTAAGGAYLGREPVYTVARLPGSVSPKFTNVCPCVVAFKGPDGSHQLLVEIDASTLAFSLEFSWASRAGMGP